MNDTVKIDLSNGKISDFIRFDTGVFAMVTGGRNMGRVGVITHRERHDGGFNIVHIKDAVDNSFATREANVFVIGSEKPWISMPKGKGVKVCLTIMQMCRLHVSDIPSLPLRKRGTGVVRMHSQATESQCEQDHNLKPYNIIAWSARESKGSDSLDILPAFHPKILVKSRCNSSLSSYW